VVFYNLIRNHILYQPDMVSHSQYHHRTPMNIFPIPSFDTKSSMIPTEIVVWCTKPAMTDMIIFVLWKLQCLKSLSCIEMPICTILSFHKRCIDCIGNWRQINRVFQFIFFPCICSVSTENTCPSFLCFFTVAYWISGMVRISGTDTFTCSFRNYPLTIDTCIFVSWIIICGKKAWWFTFINSTGKVSNQLIRVLFCSFTGYQRYDSFAFCIYNYMIPLCPIMIPLISLFFFLLIQTDSFFFSPRSSIFRLLELR